PYRKRREENENLKINTDFIFSFFFYARFLSDVKLIVPLQSMDNNPKTTDMFGRAAGIGPVAGLYFTALFLSVAYAGMYPALALVALVLFAAVPWLLYRRLWHNCATVASVRTVTLWTEGIYTFLFGGLIMALLVYLWLKYIDAEYMTNQLTLAMKVLRENPDAATPEMRNTIETALQQGAMPGPIQIAMSLFWSVTFSGSVLSLLVALIIAKVKSSVWKKKS
ncbi:MAG: DUF4199 domain-containing protein, partial [Muribaculaceae bacterium]|nr:DUF4199 domain-containing protein [Muribaculaceae bacterium]